MFVCLLDFPTGLSHNPTGFSLLQLAGFLLRLKPTPSLECALSPLMQFALSCAILITSAVERKSVAATLAVGLSVPHMYNAIKFEKTFLWFAYTKG